MSQRKMIKRALISVSDKTGLEAVAKVLSKYNVEIVSSGGTGKYLEEKGFSYTPVEKVTGNPEAFGGRMKTLSFQIGSSLLFRRDNKQDLLEAKELGIEPIDLVICNLYPFDQVVKNEGSLEELIENIDIGGPTMIRAAAKNYESVCTCTDPLEYEALINCLNENNGQIDFTTRQEFALNAFRHTANYDGLIANVLEEKFESKTRTLSLNAKNASTLRYGENPHQKGWVYANSRGKGLAKAKSVQGKALSYNNLLDADAALRCTSDLDSLTNDKHPYCVSVIKHSNPCGAALGKNSLETLQMAWEGDPISAFGSIICFNKTVEKDTAQWLSKKFIEVVLAPDFSKEALEIFSTKKNLRLIKVDLLSADENELMVRSISGGWVVQNEDVGKDIELQSMTKNEFKNESKDLAQFGIYVGKHLRSNAIAIVKSFDAGYSLIGAGMGNPNRLVSLTQASDKAISNGHDSFDGAVLISDAFFPFQDTVEAAHEVGIQNIIQPGGSIKDGEVVSRADELGMSMAFTGRRHFRH